MKALIQRVTSASVSVDNVIVGKIGQGLLVFLGVAEGDRSEDASFLADKICNLRVFSNEDGKFDKSLIDVEGSLLVVSQFTLLGDTSKGRRPNFQKAAKADDALRLYQLFRDAVLGAGVRCETGQFQAHMEVSLVNDGPVTLMLERP
ncbi:MAG: D-tyrosyl-tRNA(Tyr) deacylase [Chitinophagaceae bacterium]|nr:D-tyrosyl-tRNA(Tyr) deacylase [Oligoflexus sp.]